MKVVPHYGIMGPVKSALETAAKYMAAELGAKGIRVNTIYTVAALATDWAKIVTGEVLYLDGGYNIMAG